ncbi:hypothetical protein C8E03_1361, partial [Lachnotalea glycerini]
LATMTGAAVGMLTYGGMTKYDSVKNVSGYYKKSEYQTVLSKVVDKDLAETGIKGGKRTENVIKEIGDSIKKNPLRQEYENAVKSLSDYEAQLRAQGLSEKSIAKSMYQVRRDLGVKYKDLTPELLRKYIYEVNEARYGDPLGGSFEFFENKYKGNYSKIIEASKRPNADVDKLLSKFKEWLDTQ